MVLSEAILITAYFLGLRRTYRLALKTERRVFKRVPGIQQFAERNIKRVFRLAKRGIQEVEQRDLAFGKYLGSLVDKTPSWAFFRDPTVTRTEKIHAMRESLRAAVASRKARRAAEAAGASRADAAKIVSDREEERFEGQAPRVVIEERVKERVKEGTGGRHGVQEQERIKEGVKERAKGGGGEERLGVKEMVKDLEAAGAEGFAKEGLGAAKAEPRLERGSGETAFGLGAEVSVSSKGGPGSDPEHGGRFGRGQESGEGSGGRTVSEGGHWKGPGGGATKPNVRKTKQREASVSARGYHSGPGLAQVGPEKLGGLARLCSPGQRVVTRGRGASARFVQDCLTGGQDTSITASKSLR